MFQCRWLEGPALQPLSFWCTTTRNRNLRPAIVVTFGDLWDRQLPQEQSGRSRCCRILCLRCIGTDHVVGNSVTWTNAFGNARPEANSTELITSSNAHNFSGMTCTLPQITAIDLSHLDDLKNVQLDMLCIEGSKVRNSTNIMKSSRLRGTKTVFLGKRHAPRWWAWKDEPRKPGRSKKKVEKWRTLVWLLPG